MINTLIKKYEGCRLEAYQDPKGIWTIGWGSIWIDGRRVQHGDKITQAKADMMLCEYIKSELLPTLDNLPGYVTSSQKIALASLIYNWNAADFKKSRLYMAIIRQDKAEIIRQWDFGLKNNLNGLFKRRTEELFLFFQDIDKW